MMKTLLAITFLGLTTSVYAAPDATMKEACADKQQGDLCSFTDDKGNDFNGSCQLNPTDNVLYCLANN